MTFDTRKMNVDYKALRRMTPSERTNYAKRGLLDDVLSALTPTQVANLFPKYYAEQLPNIGISGSQAASQIGTSGSFGGGSSGGGGGGGGGGGDSGGGGNSATPVRHAPQRPFSPGESSVVEKYLGTPSGSQSGGSGTAPQINGNGTQRLLGLIASGEGGYESSNGGTIRGRIVNSTNNTLRGGKKLSELTVGEINRYMSLPPGHPDRLFAVGKYQLTKTGAWPGAVKFLGLKDTDVLTPEIQEKMGLYTIMEKRKEVGAYIRGESNDKLAAQKALALEFASIPVPVDMDVEGHGHRRAGQSAYGQGNAASHSIAEVDQALELTRQEFQQAQNNPSNNQPAQTPGTVQPAAGPSADAVGRPADQPEMTGTGDLNNQPPPVISPVGPDGSDVIPPDTTATPSTADEETPSEKYQRLKGNYPDKIDANSDIWNELDPELKANMFPKQGVGNNVSQGILDNETKLIGRDSLIAADAYMKTLRKYGYTPRIARGGGGNNHSPNHGEGRDANYSIDIGAFDAQGREIGGGGLPPEVSLEASAMAQASVDRIRIGFSTTDTSTHIQGGDPVLKNDYWGYTQTGSSSKRYLQTPLEKEFERQFGIIEGLTIEDKAKMLNNALGNGQPQTQTAEAQPAGDQTAVPAEAPQRVFIGDSIAQGMRDAAHGEGNTKVGRKPNEVLAEMEKMGPDYFKGKEVVLSSGLSNNTQDLESVRKQMEFLKQAGATVRVAGMSNSREDLAPGNQQLQDLANEYGYSFMGGFEAGRDKVHPKNYGDYLTLATPAPEPEAPAPETPPAQTPEATAETSPDLQGALPNQPETPVQDAEVHTAGVNNKDMGNVTGLVPTDPTQTGEAVEPVKIMSDKGLVGSMRPDEGIKQEDNGNISITPQTKMNADQQVPQNAAKMDGRSQMHLPTRDISLSPEERNMSDPHTSPSFQRAIGRAVGDNLRSHFGIKA